MLWVEGSEWDGLKSRGPTPAQLAERRAAFRDLRFAELAGAGHMLHHDQPEALARLVGEFLAG